MKIKTDEGLIQINKNEINVIRKLETSICYLPGDFGFQTKYSGKGIKIGIIDSGRPVHKDILEIGCSNNFCKDSKAKDYKDTVGHSTMISGIIGAKNKEKIIGLAPDSILHFAKVVDKNKFIDYNCVVASIIWSIVREFDIIVLSLGSQCGYTLLKDSIKKAYDSGICIIAAAGEQSKGNNYELNYPARYPEVLSVGEYSDENKKSIKNKCDISLPQKKYITTYLNNKYANVSGSSISTAIVSGLASLIVEKIKKEDANINKEKIPSMVYTELKNIFK
ncbi:MAG: S8 family serine peptidase [Clostridia bacterium]|jgi:subtilisin family serine protease